MSAPTELLEPDDDVTDGEVRAAATDVVAALAGITEAEDNGELLTDEKPHIAQLAAVLEVASDQAQHIAENGTAGSSLALWQLSRPGYLREIAEVPEGRSLGGSVLLPVGITWFALGVVEIIYAQEYAGQPLTERPPFFAAWLDAPVWRGPAGLSAVVVATVAILMVLAFLSGRRHDAAVRLDEKVRGWETAVHASIEKLRDLVETAERARRPDEALTGAARTLKDAAVTLNTSMPLVQRLDEQLTRLGTAVEKLITAVPLLAQQSAALRAVDDSLRETAKTSDVLLREAGQHIGSVLGEATAANDTLLRGAATANEDLLRGAATAIAALLRETAVTTDALLRDGATATAGHLRVTSTDVETGIRTATETTAARLRQAAGAASSQLTGVAQQVRDGVDEATQQVRSRAEDTVGVVDTRLRETVEAVVSQMVPVTGIIDETGKVADTVRTAAETVAAAVMAIESQLVASRMVNDQAEAFRLALGEVQAPFTRAATELVRSTGENAATAQVLKETVTAMREVVSRVRIFGLQLDGIHNDAAEHRAAAEDEV